MKTKLTANQLTGLRTLESDLARRETRQVLEDLPPGHPLLEAAQQEAARSGDIADLPDNHPLKVALVEAKERVLAQQAAEKQQEEQLKVRKSKRLQASKEYKERVDAEEEQRQKRVDACKVINEKIDNTVNSVDTLLTVLAGNFECFDEDQFARTKLARLDRMMRAVRRGLTDSRLRTARM